MRDLKLTPQIKVRTTEIWYNDTPSHLLLYDEIILTSTNFLKIVLKQLLDKKSQDSYRPIDRNNMEYYYTYFKMDM